MNIEQNTFILCFTAVIWKRIFSSLVVYSKEKKIDQSSDNILKCLKYNLLSPTGIVNIIKPYIIKTLSDGFLMPKDFEQNNYVKKAIYLFRDAYKICKIENNDYRKKKQKEFVLNYSSRIFSEEFRKENEREELDILNETSNFSELVDIWDIELSLVKLDDNYLNLIQYYLLSVLE